MPSHWGEPSQKFAKLREQLGDASDDFLDIKLLIARTTPLTSVVYAPFIVVAFMFVAQAPTLVGRGWDLAEITMWVTGLLLACGCAALLPWEANKAKKTTLGRMRDERNAAAAEFSNSFRTQKLEMLDAAILEVENADEGAFASFWRQPFMQAVVFSSGSLGLGSILSVLSSLR
jgi:hypothetical protein